MQNKNNDLINTKTPEKSPESQLALELNQARLETIKYVNKFLEAEEKWTFINLLLKELNSIREKEGLCKAVCRGLLKLTSSKVCTCCLFNADTKEIEFKKTKYSDSIEHKTYLTSFITKLNKECCSFMKEANDPGEILEYLNYHSRNQLILSPIIYSNNILGYLALLQEDQNFYQENIHLINILAEHLALILENISLYQESEERNKSKMEFLAGISHEFKTPLNSIIGFSELLKAKTKNIEDFKYIENISKSSKHLHSLIEDILDVSKCKIKKLELNYSTFRTKEVIVEVISTLEAMYKEKNITLTYTLTDININADIKRFRQLIYNLVSNAIKFNKEKGKITIFTYVDCDDFFFEITDTGDGISKKNYNKIFDFFSQVNRNQLKRQLGSGVGLALCKVITEAHGGKIDFKSKINEGSNFWFNLPLKSEK